MMGITIDRLHKPTRFNTREAAEDIADRNNELETEGWRYVVVPCQFAGVFLISVSDETGDYLGYL